MLGVGDRDLIAFVGAGGKSTLLLSLGHELAVAGRRVVLTTTTKMGADQIPEWAVPVHETAAVAPVIAAGTTPFLVGVINPSKIVGVEPAIVDAVFDGTNADYVLVEADGARGRRVKAPAPQEPVIPNRTTLVVVVASLHAVGGRISDVAHRPERVAALLRRGLDHVLEPEDVADVLRDPDGGLARIPDRARVTVALNSATPGGSAEAAEQIAGRLRSSGRIDRVAILPDLRKGFQ
jgi:molybdenum cofactor cytidylyltransferase